MLSVKFEFDDVTWKIAVNFVLTSKFCTCTKSVKRVIIFEGREHLSLFNSSGLLMHDAYDASVNWIIIAPGNGLLPTWCQAIIWTGADL